MTALRKLLHLGYELYLAEQYRAGQITLREVARRLDTPLGDALQRLSISGNVSAADTLQSLASLRNR